jgi:RimJ/RimL family protein N-acetyltransferase
MAVTEPILGRYVDLRSCTEDDAEFTRAIRRDPQFANCFPALDNTLDEQRVWIKKQREKAGDYFFVVWDKEGNRLGTISVYNIEDDHGESGRLAIKGNSLQAIEAQLLADQFGYEQLGLNRIDAFIFEENKRALRFSEMFNRRVYAHETDDSGRNIVKVVSTKEDFYSAFKKCKRVLYR